MGPGKTMSNKNQQAIDGIWGSQGITTYKGEYLPYHFSPKSDHRILCIKTPHLVAIGEKKHPLDHQNREDSDFTIQEARKTIYQNSGNSLDKQKYSRDLSTAQYRSTQGSS